MDLKDIRLITFSPTHTSRQVGEAIARGTAIKQLFVTDLTVSAGVPLVVGRQTLTLITVPVYGGHVAPLAMKRLEGIRSEGGPVVLVVVYGNRAFEQALTELQAFATGCGFKVVAGAAFIGEHSYSSSRYPIAAGRPDAADLKEAEDFGWKVADRMSETGEGRAFPVINLEHIPQPHPEKEAAFEKLFGRHGFQGEIPARVHIRVQKGEVGDEQRRSKLKERPKTHIGRCRVVRMTQSVIGFGGLFGFSGGRDEVFTGLIAVIFVFLLSHCCTKMVLVCLAPGTADVLLHSLCQHSVELGQVRCNLGLGIHGGIRFFKAKWGASLWMPCHECSWSVKKRGFLARLLSR